MYTYLGNKDLLNRNTIGFLASRKLPLNVILPTLDWAVEISNRTDVAVMSGFHSRMEKDVLKFDCITLNVPPISLSNVPGISE